MKTFFLSIFFLIGSFPSGLADQVVSPQGKQPQGARPSQTSVTADQVMNDPAFQNMSKNFSDYEEDLKVWLGDGLDSLYQDPLQAPPTGQPQWNFLPGYQPGEILQEGELLEYPKRKLAELIRDRINEANQPGEFLGGGFFGGVEPPAGNLIHNLQEFQKRFKNDTPPSIPNNQPAKDTHSGTSDEPAPSEPDSQTSIFPSPEQEWGLLPLAGLLSNEAIREGNAGQTEGEFWPAYSRIESNGSMNIPSGFAQYPPDDSVWTGPTSKPLQLKGALGNWQKNNYQGGAALSQLPMLSTSSNTSSGSGTKDC